MPTNILSIREKGLPSIARPSFAFNAQPTTDSQGLVLSVQPPAAPFQDVEHVPCEVVLVIDVSGSMQFAATPKDGGEETGLSILDLTKHAAKTIVASLNDDDKLGLITFSNEAKVIQKLTHMTESAKHAVVQKIEALDIEQATNLWAGIREGLDQFRESKAKSSSTRALFVLTDGQPNHMCPPKGYIPALQPLLKKSSTGDSPCVQINTFGFGYDIRSGLLHSIAQLSGGNYGFIPDCGMIGTVFVHAMANLFATCASGAVLQLEISSGGNITVGAGLQAKVRKVRSKQQISIPLGSLLYGQPREVYLHCDDQFLDDLSLEADLSYYVDGEVVKERLTGPDYDDTLYPLSREASLYSSMRAEMCEMLEALFPARKDGERQAIPYRSLEPTRERLEKLLQDVRSSHGQTDELVQSLLDDLAGDESTGQVSKAISKAEFYDRWGKHYLLSLLNAHQKQYCNSFKDPGPLQYGTNSALFTKCRDQLNEIFDGMVIKRTVNAYPTNPFAPPSYTTAVGARFNRADIDCFAGDCRLSMDDGTMKALSELWPSELVQTQVGPRKVVAILKTEVSDVAMRQIDGLTITPWHPIYQGSSWRFPAETSGEDVCYTGPIYSVLLEPSADPSQHSIIIDGIVCTTMGHGILRKGTTNDPRGHELYGDYAEIVSRLSHVRKDSHGIHVSHNGLKNVQGSLEAPPPVRLEEMDTTCGPAYDQHATQTTRTIALEA